MALVLSNLVLLSQKYHYYFLILAVQLLTYIAIIFQCTNCWFPFPTLIWLWKVMWPVNLQSYNSCFILSSLIITPNEPKLLIHTFHIIEAFQPGNRTCASQFEYAEYTLLWVSVGKAPHLYVYCAGKAMYPCFNDSEGKGFIHIQYFILSSVLWCAKLNTGVAMVAVFAAANMHNSGVCCCPMLGMSHSQPPPLFTQCHFLLTCCYVP